MRSHGADEVDLEFLGGRFEDEVGGVDVVEDGAQHVLADVAVGAGDPAATALARLGDHLGGASVEVFVDGGDPVAGGEARRARGVLEADLREHRELAGETVDARCLHVLVERDGSVRHLDVRGAAAAHQLGELVHATGPQVALEERATEEVGNAGLAQHRDLAVEVGRHQRRAPAELDQVDVLAVAVHRIGEDAGGHARVDDHGATCHRFVMLRW